MNKPETIVITPNDKRIWEIEAAIAEISAALICGTRKKYDIERQDSCEHDNYLPDRLHELTAELNTLKGSR